MEYVEKLEICTTRNISRWWQRIYSRVQNQLIPLYQWISSRTISRMHPGLQVCLPEREGGLLPGACTRWGLSGDPRPEEHRIPSSTLIGMLWPWRWPLVTLLGLQVLDLQTTWYILVNGGVEFNPFLSNHTESVIFWPFMILLKLWFVGIVGYILEHSGKIHLKGANIIASACLVVYTVVVGNNLLQIFLYS